MKIWEVSYRFIAFYLIVLISEPIFAKNEGSQLLDLFSARFAVMDSVVRYFGADAQTYVFRHNRSRLDTLSLASIDLVTRAKVEELKSHTGVGLVGQVYGRPFSETMMDNDDPLVAYNAKLQVSLEWDFFNSSFYKRRQKTDLIYLQGQLDIMQSVQDAATGYVAQERAKLRRLNNSYLLGVLKEHAQNINLLMQANAYLLGAGRISSEELLTLVSEKAELDRQILSIEADSVHSALLPSYPRSIRVDSVTLMQQVRNAYVGLQQIHTQTQMLDVQRQLSTYGQNVQLTPFARWAYYNRTGAPNTQNVDVGVSFRVPLDNQARKKRKVLSAQREELIVQAKQLEEQVIDRLRLILTDLSSYDDNIRGEFKRMKELGEYLRNRNHAYNNALDGNYSRLQRLKEYNAYLSSWERMLMFQAQRDDRLLDLQIYLYDEPVGKYLNMSTLQ